MPVSTQEVFLIGVKIVWKQQSACAVMRDTAWSLLIGQEGFEQFVNV